MAKIKTGRVDTTLGKVAAFCAQQQNQLNHKRQLLKAFIWDSSLAFFLGQLENKSFVFLKCSCLRHL